MTLKLRFVQLTNKSEAKKLEFKSPVVAKIVAGLAALWVQFPSVLGVLFWMMVLDYISGIAAAGSQGKIESAIARRGIYRKVAELALAVSGYVVSTAVVPEIHGFAGIDMGAGLCGFLIVAEFISIAENAGKAGVPIPQTLKAWLAKLREGEAVSK